MKIPITLDSVVAFLEDEKLGPIKIKKNDNYNFKLKINEPYMWGSNDSKMRCGIAMKEINGKLEPVFHCFKAYALYGEDYSGHLFKFIKLIKQLDSVYEAKKYFYENYIFNQYINFDNVEKIKQESLQTKSEIYFEDYFERLDFKNIHHKPYIDYITSRGVSVEKINLLNLLVNKKFKRLVFPIYEDNKLIFYTGRDITNKNILPWQKIEAEDVYPIWNLEHINTQVIYIFEGIFDAIHFNNGVALLGTGSQEQFKKILKRDFSKIVLFFDNDEPGRNARYKWAEWLTEENHQGVYVFDWQGIKVKDFSLIKENNLNLNFTNRIHKWNDLTRAKFLMKMIT